MRQHGVNVITVTLAMGLAACSGDETPTPTGPCPGGEMVSYQGDAFCVMAKALIIETGFQCPPTMGFAFEGPGFAVCSSRSDMAGDDVAVVGALGGQGCAAPQLDVLLMVDNSSSMAAAQAQLSHKIAKFAQQLDALGADVRMAVVTPDLACAPGPQAPTGGGRFSTAAVTTFPPTARIKLSALCTSDADCAAEFGGEVEAWACQHPSTEACVENPNGSINTACWQRCDTDAECQTRNGDPTAICHQLGWGCVLTPPQVVCPAEVQVGVRSWLVTGELDRIGCIATVGVNQGHCVKFEQGLGAAWSALDPAGENGLQATEFIRPNAHLALIFVSDEDDCTAADGASISEVDYDVCSTLGDTSGGGPLEPVDAIAARFQALKGPDRQVLVAAMSGDALETTAEATASAREDFWASLTDPKICSVMTTICSGPLGQAKYGARYFAFAAAFGAQGGVANFCAADPLSDGFAGLMMRITELPPESCGVH